MSQNESVLEGILERVKEGRGIEHFAARAALINYLGRITDSEFSRAVEAIADERLFGYLLASGLSMDRQRILAERKAGG